MSSTSSPSIILQKTQTPIILSLLHNSPLSISTPCNLRFPPLTRTFIVNTSPNFYSQSLFYAVSRAQPEEEDESVIGDCLVYEEGIFDDPFLQSTLYLRNDGESAPSVRKSNSKDTTEVSPEYLIPDRWLDVQREINNSNKDRRNDNVSAPIVRKSPVRKSNSKDTTYVSPETLIPDTWLDVQREINISNKERRKLSQQLEYDTRVEKRRQALRPINSNSEEFKKFKNEKLRQLKPLVLNDPEPPERLEENDNKFEEKRGDDGRRSREVVTGRVAPRNPRLAVYGGGLEDISAVFSSGNYDHGAAEKSQGTRKLFSKEEKLLLNRKVPYLAVAISGKWHPLHSLAASGEFYLVISLLKHNLDINAPDKNGLTAIHKAILGKKQAIFNFLLRESANPFVLDNEGATLMHYAVFTASSQMIKILLLYNVDINLQDNDGWTPLHLAVQSRRTDIVRLLLIKGADKSLKNRNGFTALDLCLYSGRDTRTYEVIKQLKLLP